MSGGECPPDRFNDRGMYSNNHASYYDKQLPLWYPYIPMVPGVFDDPMGFLEVTEIIGFRYFNCNFSIFIAFRSDFIEYVSIMIPLNSIRVQMVE